METIYVKKLDGVKKLKSELEKKLKIKIRILSGGVEIDGLSLDEYDALQVFDAINFGFNIRKALLLKEEDMVFKKIHIKDYTKRNLRAVKSRLIGTRGKTRKTISEISDCEVLIREGEVGVIGDVESVDNVLIAIINIIKGSKQSNMYKYLQKMNRISKGNDLILEK